MRCYAQLRSTSSRYIRSTGMYCRFIFSALVCPSSALDRLLNVMDRLKWQRERKKRPPRLFYYHLFTALASCFHSVGDVEWPKDIEARDLVSKCLVLMTPPDDPDKSHGVSRVVAPLGISPPTAHTSRTHIASPPLGRHCARHHLLRGGHPGLRGRRHVEGGALSHETHVRRRPAAGQDSLQLGHHRGKGPRSRRRFLHFLSLYPFSCFPLHFPCVHPCIGSAVCHAAEE